MSSPHENRPVMRDGTRPSAASSGARVGAGRADRLLARRTRFSAAMMACLLVGARCGGGHTDGAEALPCACSGSEVCIGGACVAQAARECACSGWQVCTAAGACVDPPRTAPYEVGACYHDTGTWALDASGEIVPESMQVFVRATTCRACARRCARSSRPWPRRASTS
jgi:hypothetical protein